MVLNRTWANCHQTKHDIQAPKIKVPDDPKCQTNKQVQVVLCTALQSHQVQSLPRSHHGGLLIRSGWKCVTNTDRRKALIKNNRQNQWDSSYPTQTQGDFANSTHSIKTTVRVHSSSYHSPVTTTTHLTVSHQPLPHHQCYHLHLCSTLRLHSVSAGTFFTIFRTFQHNLCLTTSTACWLPGFPMPVVMWSFPAPVFCQLKHLLGQQFTKCQAAAASSPLCCPVTCSDSALSSTPSPAWAPVVPMPFPVLWVYPHRSPINSDLLQEPRTVMSPEPCPSGVCHTLSNSFPVVSSNNLSSFFNWFNLSPLKTRTFSLWGDRTNHCAIVPSCILRQVLPKMNRDHCLHSL